MSSPDGKNNGDGVLHVTDSRTGRSYQIPIAAGAIRATDLISRWPGCC